MASESGKQHNAVRENYPNPHLFNSVWERYWVEVNPSLPTPIAISQAPADDRIQPASERLDRFVEFFSCQGEQ